ncbi:centrosomal of 126 kDa [Pelobates cultripes]|uniref:Centrosomal of 126 kDa n=1 Tax=Pelobates cultripes TaxID=61616 RepID=A0AAD1R8B2_PELCU|nr:centrosomal of 126 kDa [Pelobates cultripes]
MQNRHTKSYSNLKTQLEIDLEEERQTLLQDQKVYRMRAQKLSVETNRRRKALEEKRKEEEEKEQKFREEVLQQRKLKLQEATEKFQRAHLPPSQRRRTAYVVSRKPTPNLEDALEQIQGSVSSTNYYLFPNRNSSNTRSRGTPSSLFSAGNGTWHKNQRPDSTLGFERLVHEQKIPNTNQFDSNRLYFQHKLEEAQRLLEEHHLSNLQNFHQEVNQLARSKSLDSLDSLEEELDEKDQRNVLEDFICENGYKEISPYSINNSDPETKHCTVNENTSYLNDKNLLFDQMPTAKYLHSRDQAIMLARTTEQQGTNNFIQNEITHTENALVTQNQENAQKFIFDHKIRNYDLGSGEKRTSHFVVVPSKAWATPDPASGDASQGSVPHENKETIKHQGVSFKPTVTQPLATPVVVPLVEWERSASKCHDGVGTYVKKDINVVLSDARTNNLTATNNADFISMNNKRTEYLDSKNQELLVHEDPSFMSSVNKDFGVLHDQSPSSSSTSVTPTDPEPGFIGQYRKTRNNASGKDGNRLLKSILKKGSKYENGYIRGMGFSKVLHLGDKSNLGVRDSVELTKEKENKKIICKKLRWLDEIDKMMDGKDAVVVNKRVSGVEKAMSENLSSTSHQGCAFSNTNLLPERTEPLSVPQSSVFSTGYHFTKQAWVTSKGVESNSSEHNSRNLPKAKTKLVKRPKSAKNQYTVTHRNRKGTIIRPQSATEASKILKSQGKVMMPHPPPRPALENNSGQNATDAKMQYVNNNNYQFNNSSNSSHITAKDTGSNQSLVRASSNLMTNQNCNSSEPAIKSVLALNNDRPLAVQEPSSGPTKRYPIYGENGLRLDHTPTDEEIALLWQGVRSALNHKNAGDFRSGELASNLNSLRPNLSHVLIDGGTLLTNWKSFSRMNGAFSPANNGYITLARRKQIADSSENKRRALLEQRKGRANSAGLRNHHVQNPHTLKINPFPSTHEPFQAYNTPRFNEVSDSTAQFMVAENLVETSATDGEILAAMQAIPTKQNVLNHKAHTIGPSALSLEEQKLLQSLDRLNQRLQNVQDVIVKPPIAANGFKSPLNIQQLSSQPTENTTQMTKYRSFSADPRTRLQRRY